MIYFLLIISVLFVIYPPLTAIVLGCLLAIVFCGFVLAVLLPAVTAALTGR